MGDQPTTSAGNRDSNRVEFVTVTGTVLDAPVPVVRQNRVLNMLLQYAGDVQPARLQVDDEPCVFENFLRYLQAEAVMFEQMNVSDVLLHLRCAHKYQHYMMATEILKYLGKSCRSHNVLHIHNMLSEFPELPEHAEDPSAPSAPPVVDLQSVDPEQAQFARRLADVFSQCLQLIDTNTAAVLASDALLAVPGDSLAKLAARDTLSASELEIGRALLRWCRHHTLHGRSTMSERRCLVLGCVRLLTMPLKELRRLELSRAGVLTAEEQTALLEWRLHAGGELPASLHPYCDSWLQRRRGPAGSGACRRGILQRLAGRRRTGSWSPPESASGTTAAASAGERRVHFSRVDREMSAAEQREATLEKKQRRADKIKMALATGASLLFD